MVVMGIDDNTVEVLIFDSEVEVIVGTETVFVEIDCDSLTLSINFWDVFAFI